MKDTVDVAIIGAGIVGTSIARELSRYKLNVSVLEKEEEPAFGISKSNSGIIHPGTQNPVGSLKAQLCIQGNRLTRRIAKELDVDFQEVGELIVAFTEEEMFRLHRLHNEALAMKIPGVKFVDQIWLRRNEPNLSPKVLAALYAPSAAIVSPYRMVYALAENARENGVAIHTLTKLMHIRRSDAGFILETNRGEFASRYVVNCAGLFADEVSAMVGVSDFTIVPVKGEEFILDKKRQNLTNRLVFPLPSKGTKGILVIKTADGNPMIGPTAEEVNDKHDLSTTEAGLAKVLTAARQLVPSINGEDIIAYFAGLRPTAGEDFIIRHEKRVPGFINVAGIQSPGLTAAPAIAQMVCEILGSQGLTLAKKLLFRSHRPHTVHLFSVKLSETQKLIENDPAYGDIVCRCEMVSAKEIEDAIEAGATTLDGLKFRTRCQAGRCHGSFCTTRVMKILSAKTGVGLTAISKRGRGSQIIKKDRADEAT